MLFKLLKNFLRSELFLKFKRKNILIEKVKTEEFWENVDVFELEEVRDALRILKYLRRETQTIYYTSFDDFIIAEESNAAMYNTNDA